ncbi:peptidylprolyl isomerase [Rhizobium sp. L1K21]|uniref:peptidylprolyl isomerase n=1 Tax=Rhizobium sp. L1K21 TaxID=2954933 RepID=UPI0020929588|nr:peptidylprolyl isomerase [Rhizobium sp. L1K21]MCO6186061.1 SurA N-terminal domain-containing protein [Rhizobium sp. L1K21]
MMDLLRRGAQTWIAKFFFVLLVASFGVWGISSSLVSSPSTAVVTVGDQTVDAPEFRLNYERQLALLSRQLGTRLTTEQARAFGVDRQVFAQLAAGAALDQLADDMNLGLSEERLAQIIAEEPAFRAPSGRFDRTVFANALRNAGLNEEDYIKSQSKVAVRSQIVDAVANGFEPPAALSSALKEYQNQVRDVDYIVLSSANIDPIAAPSDDVLSKWFEEHKKEYRAPEYRTFTYLKLEPSDIMDVNAVAESEVKADYEKNKDRYSTPASRTIDQLSFADKAAADDAAAKLASGEATFDELVKENGKTEKDVNLGNFTPATFPDKKTADAAFAISENGGTSPVVDGTFGPVILRATDIKPENTKSYDEVKDEIRKDIALNLAADEILNVHDAYEDARAGGATLAEAAKQLRLTPVKISDIDENGEDMSGKKVADLPEERKLLTSVFDTDPGVEALPIDIGREGYLWFEVDSITPDRDRTLDEVKDKVLADWKAEATADALKAKAQAVLQDVKGGKSLEEVATELALPVNTKSNLKRSGSADAVFGNEAVAGAYGGPEGHAATAPSADGSAQLVLVVKSTGEGASVDALSADNGQVERLAQAAGDDILDQMVSKLQATYGVQINQTLAQQAMVR